VVSNPDIKQIRIAAEEEELESYESHVERLAGRLETITDLAQTLLETAPYHCLRRIYEFAADGKKKNNYYVQESVGLATGFYCRFTMRA
jgi:hypothetical protein